MTNGHLDIVERASRLFDQVIVAVYELPPERCLFTTDQRVALVASSLDARVASGSGLVLWAAPVLRKGTWRCGNRPRPPRRDRLIDRVRPGPHVSGHGRCHRAGVSHERSPPHLFERVAYS